MPSRSYYTLIGSLPALPSHFQQAQRLPISEIRLEERLKMLVPEDRQVIDQVGNFLVWDRQPLDRTDEQVIDYYRSLVKTVENRLLREIITTAMNYRTVVGALRQRHRGKGPLGVDTHLARHIERHWKQADFRLGGRFPWIVDIDPLLARAHPADAEVAMINVVWANCQRIMARFSTKPFAFESLIIYLLRWEIVYRWTQRDYERGKSSFEVLATKAMGEFAKIYPE